MVKLTDIFTPGEFQDCQHVSGVRVLRDLVLVWGQAAIGVALFAGFQNLPSFLAGVLLVGGSQHGMSLIAHEGAHYLIVPNNRRLNDAIASWLFAAPIMLPFTLYRGRHMTHHRKVCLPEDTKEIYKRDLKGWRLPLELFRSFLGLDYLNQVYQTLTRDRDDRKEQEGASAPASPNWMLRDFSRIAVVQLTLLGGLSFIDPWLYPLLWVLPNMTVAMACGKVRSAIEHHPYQREANADAASPYFMRTAGPLFRTVRATWLERMFFSKINFHFHGEHHLWPTIGYQHLPKIHQRLNEEGLLGESGIAADRSYLSVMFKLWKGV